MTITDEQYDALRSLQVEAEDGATVTAHDVAVNLAMRTSRGQDPALWHDRLVELVGLGLAREVSDGFLPTDAGYKLVDDLMSARVARMRAEIAAGRDPFEG